MAIDQFVDPVVGLTWLSRSARPPVRARTRRSSRRRPAHAGRGRWPAVVAAETRSALTVEDAGLPQRLDRRRPGPAIEPVAVLDLDGQPGRPGLAASRSAGRAGSPTPRSASIPALLTSRPGAAFISEVSSRSCRPATISGLASIASRTPSAARRRRRAGRRPGRPRGRPGTRRRGRPRAAGRRTSRRRSRRSPSAASPGVVPKRARPPRDSATCDGWLGVPVVVRLPAVQPRQEQRDACAARSTCGGSARPSRRRARGAPPSARPAARPRSRRRGAPG